VLSQVMRMRWKEEKIVCWTNLQTNMRWRIEQVIQINNLWFNASKRMEATYVSERYLHCFRYGLMLLEVTLTFSHLTQFSPTNTWTYLVTSFLYSPRCCLTLYDPLSLHLFILCLPVYHFRALIPYIFFSTYY
jgi:hypothetical protein